MNDAARPSLMSNVVSVLIGLALIGVGLAGLVLPILPGWLLIIAGLVMLAGVLPPLRRGVSRMVDSSLVQRVISEAAKSPGIRKTMGRAMQLPVVRRGLDHACRWRVVNALLVQSTTQQAATSASTGATPSQAARRPHGVLDAEPSREF